MSAMKANRTLKIEEHGQDGRAYRKRPCPKIRLKGHWLQAAGFSPGASVELTVISPGVIEIRVCSPVQLDGRAFRIMGQIDRAMEKCV